MKPHSLLPDISLSNLDDFLFIASTICDSCRTFVSLYDHKPGHHHLAMTRGVDTDTFGQLLPTLDTVIKTRQPLFSPQLAIFPLIDDDHFYGLLGLLDLEGQSLNPTQIESLKRLATQAAITLTTRLRKEQFEETSQLLSAILEAMPDAVVTARPDGHLGEFNRLAREWHGVDPRALPPEEWSHHFDLYHADGTTLLATDEIPLFRAFNGEIVRDAEIVIAAKDQPPRWVLCNADRITSADGQPLGAVAIMRDVTELRRTNIQLQHSQEHIHNLLHSVGEAILAIDADGLITYANPLATRRFSVGQDLVGTALSEILLLATESDPDTPLDLAPLLALDATDCHYPPDLLLFTGSGPLPISITKTISRFEHISHPTDPREIVLVFHDITRERTNTSQARALASHDELTQILNRRGFNDALKKALRRVSSAHPRTSSLLILDLDYFKPINDTFGHPAGDFMLQQIAELLRDHVRHNDIVARFGGDEFAIILHHCALPKAQSIAQDICLAIDQLAAPWEGHTLSLSASIGVTEFHPGEDPDTVITRTDNAAYEAKDRGKNQVFIAPAPSSLTT